MTAMRTSCQAVVTPGSARLTDYGLGSLLPADVRLLLAYSLYIELFHIGNTTLSPCPGSSQMKFSLLRLSPSPGSI